MNEWEDGHVVLEASVGKGKQFCHQITGEDVFLSVGPVLRLIGASIS